MVLIIIFDVFSANMNKKGIKKGLNYSFDLSITPI